MAYTIKKVEVWAADVLNQPGVLARILEGLSDAGAELEFMIGRRINEKTSRVYLSPLRGKKQKLAAADVGMVPAKGMHSIRIEGPDRKGLGAELSRAVATEGLNIAGVSAAMLGRKCVCYMAFKTEDEAKSAGQIIRKALRGKRAKKK